MVDPSVESEVLRLLGADNRDGAATALIRGYGPRVLGYLRAMLRDEDLAADAFSEFGERAWRNIANFRQDGSVLGWAYAVAWSALCRVVEPAYQRRRVSLGTTQAEQIVEKVRTSTRPYMATAIKDAVAELRSKLDRDEQTLLFLRIDQDLPWNEVSAIMNVDAAALRKRFERVKDKLRELADAAGLLDE